MVHLAGRVGEGHPQEGAGLVVAAHVVAEAARVHAAVLTDLTGTGAVGAATHSTPVAITPPRVEEGDGGGHKVAVLQQGARGSSARHLRRGQGRGGGAQLAGSGVSGNRVIGERLAPVGLCRFAVRLLHTHTLVTDGEAELLGGHLIRLGCYPDKCTVLALEALDLAAALLHLHLHTVNVNHTFTLLLDGLGLVSRDVPPGLGAAQGRVLAAELDGEGGGALTE
mmetsp:Transcript_36151/g.80447  ORF Transcript_36151/g.80447 Transcript_36151/m.80447 type:complete len:224 (+) Transcript_36151:1204-1875(+)